MYSWYLLERLFGSGAAVVITGIVQVHHEGGGASVRPPGAAVITSMLLLLLGSCCHVRAAAAAVQLVHLELQLKLWDNEGGQWGVRLLLLLLDLWFQKQDIF